MKALFDVDSLFYLACYKLDDPAFVEKCGLSNEDYDTIIGTLAEIGYDRLTGMIDDIMMAIANDKNNIKISGIEFYVTNCKDSIRKKIYPLYKSNRVPNDIVNCLRNLYIIKDDAKYSEIYEADDLIADMAKELGDGNYMVVTMDKDLLQIPGWCYSFYRKPSKKDETGYPIETFSRKGLMYSAKFESYRFFAKQIIMGDSGDKIPGLPRYGEVKASKIVDPIKTVFGLKRAVVNEYKKVYGAEYQKELLITFRLVFLGFYYQRIR